VLPSLPELKKEGSLPHPSRKKKLLKFKREARLTIWSLAGGGFEDRRKTIIGPNCSEHSCNQGCKPARGKKPMEQCPLDY
jgi:hypothetical protein